MIIVSDTSAVTSLLQIGRLEILPALYQQVVIPVEVAEELKHFHTDLPGFIEILPITDRTRQGAHLDIVLDWLSFNQSLYLEAKDENKPLTPADDRHRLSPFGRGEGETLPAFSGIMPSATRMIKQGQCRDAPRLARLQTELDLGEAAAIVLMLEGKGDLLLMDERRGRKTAMREGLVVVGVIGVLLEARRRGLIDSLTEVIRQLEQIADFRISPELKQRILQTAGEK